MQCANNEDDIYLPQGVITTHYRNKHTLHQAYTNLNTNVDPRYSGGKVNTCATEVSVIDRN